MIVYADREEWVDARALLRHIEAAADPLERLIRSGQWESGVLDALCPEFDDDIDLSAVRIPERIRVRVPEGFAFYALYPEQYRDAALRFFTGERPDACVVVGIRSIGSTLSRVVADALPCPTWRFTVRPHGHPFERCVRLGPQLQQRIREHASDWFLVVDEGPGLSGSSFASVADALAELGVPPQRIVLFPSHEPDSSALLSDRARAAWDRHRRYLEPFRPERYVPSGARDLSGGKWREIVCCDVPVQPQHERRKYLHRGRLYKFAGLAHYGRAKLERGRELASAGFTPPVLECVNGFLVLEFVDARPAIEAVAGLLDAIAAYLRHLRTHYSTGQPVPYAAIAAMVQHNTGIALPSACAVVEDQCTVAIDGRMLPFEWLQTPEGHWLKADALDHHDDHFFPGCQDIAWDVAAVCVEFEVPVDCMLERFPHEPGLRERIDFYTIAYLAFRIGYTSVWADCPGFGELKRRYTATLERVAARPASSNT
jgi:hypothetical protein